MSAESEAIIRMAIEASIEREPPSNAPLLRKMADSARLVDLEKRREFYDDGEPMLENQGYNAAIDEILGGK